MGPTGLDETWLWYDTEGRGDELVKTKKCEPAEVLWPGYKCVNGIAETSKVKILLFKIPKSRALIDSRTICLDQIGRERGLASINLLTLICIFFYRQNL